jgi:hypothetical protein
MSFTCYHTNEHVKGKTRVLVPIEKRKVFYHNVLKKKDRSGNEEIVYLGEPTIGWEISKQVSTTQEYEELIKEQYKDNYNQNPKRVLNFVSYKSLNKERKERSDETEQ